jgi:Kef-type K+ transport system membrane component KefB
MTNPLIQLAIIWVGVLCCGLLASRSKLTSVLSLLALGAVMANTGVLPEELHPFIQSFAKLAFMVLAIAYVENPILNTEAFYTLMSTMS